MARNRHGCDGSCSSGRGQVQELLPDISSHGQPLLTPPHTALSEYLPVSPEGRGAVPSSAVSKLALSSGRQTPRMGEGVLTAQLLTYKQATVVKDSAVQLDHFIYLLPAHCKCEVNYFAIAEV